MSEPRQQAVVGKYKQRSISARLEAFFLDNVGKIASRTQILAVAKDPKTREEPENWHQRLSELRTNSGYTILSYRDTRDLKVGEYMLASRDRRESAGKRVVCSMDAWQKVLARSNDRCEWNEAGQKCNLKEGAIDPVGGGTVRLSADHMIPHSIQSIVDPDNPSEWQALCGRHQIIKRNYWNSTTGKLNAYAIVQASALNDKREIYEYLRTLFESESP